MPVERWIPQTEEELETAISDGRLVENHYLDFKQELGQGDRANKELAKDLAMFANEGGALIYGVAEPQDGVFETAPIPLAGLPERISQVAASRCDPPLFVDVRTITSAGDDQGGYVVVRVPSSSGAPHMVDGRYYGRAGTTRTTLSDRQVRAILDQRKERMRPVEELLDEDLARDPIPEEHRTAGHIHLVARPSFGPPDLVLRDVRERHYGNWSGWLQVDLIGRVTTSRLGPLPLDVIEGLNVGDRANGAALHGAYMGQDRSASQLTTAPDALIRFEGKLIDLEVQEDGTVHLFAGRGTDPNNVGPPLVKPRVVAGLTVRLVQVADAISALTGYVGNWQFGMHVDRLRGAQVLDSRYIQGPAYSVDFYRETTEADTAEISCAHREVADRLVGRLLRGLGIHVNVSTLLEQGSF